MREYWQDLSEFSYLETNCLASTQNRVGLLGGTFNPIHCGHISMAYIALYEFSLGEIMFLPLGTPPHKQNEHIASVEHRLEMIRLAIADEKRFSLSTVETNRAGYTYTVDTLELLTRTYTDKEYYYIIGADTLFELLSWKNYERVFLLTSFICILRPGQDDIRVRQYAKELNSRFGQKIYVAEEPGPCISSSRIRRHAADGKLLRGLVPDEVASYIQKNGIYREGI